MSRNQKVKELVESWPYDFQLMLHRHFTPRYPRAAKKVRVVRKWLNRMKRVRSIMDRRYPVGE